MANDMLNKYQNQFLKLVFKKIENTSLIEYVPPLIKKKFQWCSCMYSTYTKIKDENKQKK